MDTIVGCCEKCGEETDLMENALLSNGVYKDICQECLTVYTELKNSTNPIKKTKTKPKNECPSEEYECQELAIYLDRLLVSGEVLAYSHLAQSTYTQSWTVKNRNKRMGVNPGVPDYVIVLKNKVIFIEMKKMKGSKTSDYQKHWLRVLDGKHTHTFVCKGFEEAKKAVESIK